MAGPESGQGKGRAMVQHDAAEELSSRGLVEISRCLTNP
jgi:hypothetical protein